MKRPTKHRVERRLIIGFDAEWQEKENEHGEKYRKILSYQFHAISANSEWSAIVYLERESKTRLRLRDTLRTFIERGLDEGYIEGWPTEIVLAAHWSFIDLTTFSDFDKIKKQFDAIRGTYLSLRPTTWHFESSRGDKKKVTIVLRDTKLLAPAKKQKLEDLGELLGLKKLELPPGYSKDDMETFMRERPREFKAYAIRDAEVAAGYTKRIAEINTKETGLTDVPATLSTIALEVLTQCLAREEINRLDVTGQVRVKKKVHDAKSGHMRSRSSVELMDERRLLEELSKLCYHGGRGECYQFGASGKSNWIDADLVSAYVVAMETLGMPDWENAVNTQRVEDFTLNNYGVAQVRFIFPSDTRFPCLPVTSDGSLVFPLQGVSFCASPELLLAIEMGAEVEVVHGAAVPSDANVRPFAGFAQFCLEKRNSYEKGSLENLFWKELSNSLYGKTAQGLGGKRVFDNRKGVYDDMKPSYITCPLIAAQITSMVRAAVGEMMFRLPESVSILSVTTDGFLSNATREQLEGSAEGDVCKTLLEGVKRLTDKTSVWEIKHTAVEILTWKTRAQVAIETDVGEPVVARGIFRPPRPDDKKPDNIKVADFLIEKFVKREGKVSNPLDQRYPSIADLHQRNVEVIPGIQERRLSMEHDFKRRPINPRIQKIRGEDHLFFETAPWETVEDFTACREAWERYSKNDPKSLKTVQDFEDFEEYRSLPGKHRPHSNGSLKLAKRWFLNILVHGEEGLSIDPYSYAEIAQWLTDGGYPTKKVDLKNAKRKSPKDSPLPPLTAKVKAFLSYVATRFPKVLCVISEK